ncbi:hypothetical protein [Paenibacillus montanisoli]|uniref:Uncharacterized protein n=1 Tax=Paenibacillus montanisoli TaxID=2081970 RepID=A0A328TS67_9BACL|nr:hypothetical protein [Paenibacillus montanisoli]RAP73437.1 hypothetical protein DL346_27440 [Paenibacillus montanisoli]
MKRNIVMAMMLVASLMVSAAPAFAAAKAEAKPERTVKAEAKPERTVKAEAKPERTVKAEAKPERTMSSDGPTMPELPVVP